MKSLYRYSIEDARENNQLPEWRESHRENKCCRDFLDELIKNNWDGMHLSGYTALTAVNEFGYDRTMWVLANHIQHNKDDTRFHPDNREWAKGIYVPRPSKEQMRRGPNLTDHSDEYLLQSHPEKVNELTGQVRKLYDGLSMFDHRHRVPDGDREDYKGKILIVRASWLNEKYKSPKYQLFLAQSGFGCDPSASGRAVFGQFLIDGEKARLDRGDFVGVLDEQYLPSWAVNALHSPEKLQQGQTDSDAPDEGSQPVMKGM
jgi:hypothetical protein